MRAVELSKRPSFGLMKQNDVVSFYHMQMPRWLFFDPKYKGLSLEAKVAYTFLLNRFQLSKMNGWINSEGEVFIIYTREKLADEMGVSYRKAISCFKELLSAELIWERRVGRGHANQIYIATVLLTNEDASPYETAPFESRHAKSVYHDSPSDQDMSSKTTLSQHQSENDVQDMKCKNRTSECAIPADSDIRFSHSIKKEDINKDYRDIEKVSPSHRAWADDERIDDEPNQLEEILENCEFEILNEEEAGVFRNIVTRLFYSDSFTIGNAILPREVIRSNLRSLDGLIILDTREKLRLNVDKPIRNSTKYIMTTLMNNIWESKSDLMVDPFLNST